MSFDFIAEIMYGATKVVTHVNAISLGFSDLLM
jgi:hypothetical protein